MEATPRQAFLVLVGLLLAGCAGMGESEWEQPEPWEEDVPGVYYATQDYEVSGEPGRMAWDLRVARGAVDFYMMPPASQKAFLDGEAFEHYAGAKAEETQRSVGHLDVPEGTHTFGIRCLSEDGCAWRLNVTMSDPPGTPRAPALETVTPGSLPEVIAEDERDTIAPDHVLTLGFEVLKATEVSYEVRSDAGANIDVCLARDEEGQRWADGEPAATWACSEDTHLASGQTSLPPGEYELAVVCDDEEACNVAYSIHTT